MCSNKSNECFFWNKKNHFLSFRKKKTRRRKKKNFMTPRWNSFLLGNNDLNVCHHVSLSIDNMLLIYEEYSSLGVWEKKSKGLRRCGVLYQTSGDGVPVPGWKVALMSRTSRISHMSLLVSSTFQEQQSCRGESTTRSNCSLGEFPLNILWCSDFMFPFVILIAFRWSLRHFISFSCILLRDSRVCVLFRGFCLFFL